MSISTTSTIILDNLCTAVILLDSELRVSYLNSAAEALLDVSDKRVHGYDVSEVFNETGNAKTQLARASEERQPFTKREAELVLQGGQTVMVDYMVTPLDNSDLLIELLPRERLLRISREEEIIAKQETTRSLVRGLAHEIKNPLGGIRGAAQLLEKELPHSGLSEYTHVIIEEADRLRNLVDKMLGPRNIPQESDTNIHEVLERVYSLIDAETEGQLLLIRDYDPSIPPMWADRENLIQAMLNIVRNAMEALNEHPPAHELAHITLRTRIMRQFTIGPVRHRLVCRIEVIDNGPGIKKEILENEELN